MTPGAFETADRSGRRMWASPAHLRFLPIRRKVAFIAVPFLLLLCLMPPDGILTDNEEDYFALAERFFTGAAVPPDSALFDSSPHRAVNEILLGGIVVAVGHERAQIVARLVLAVAFAILLYAMFDLFGLSPVDGAIVLSIFGLLGQQIIGGEWLFSGYEAKVAAYAFVLAGLVATVARRRPWASVALFAVATYFHFLVGIFWFHAALLWRVVDDRHALKSVAITAAWFWLSVSPLVGIIAWKRWITDAAVPVPSGMPSPDYIYSILREPWHGAPFVDLHSFVTFWLSGSVLAGGMLAGALVITMTATAPRLRATARWFILLLVYLFAALAFSYLHRRTGVLGKFYLFRPSSLVLLIWLTAVVAWLNELAPRHPALLKLAALALVLPPFATASALNLGRGIKTRVEIATDKQTVQDFLRGGTAPDAVVLVDPEIEFNFLDIERATSRFALVMWKFMPTNDPQILEWYRRIEFRRTTFEKGCGSETPYRMDYLLTTSERSKFLATSCGPPVLETGRFVLLRHQPTAAGY